MPIFITAFLELVASVDADMAPTAMRVRSNLGKRPRETALRNCGHHALNRMALRFDE
jgi:hypothetical protein